MNYDFYYLESKNPVLDAFELNKFIKTHFVTVLLFFQE